MPFALTRPLVQALLSAVTSAAEGGSINGTTAAAAARALGCLLNREAKGALVDDLCDNVLGAGLLPVVSQPTARPAVVVQGMRGQHGESGGEVGGLGPLVSRRCEGGCAVCMTT